MDILDVLDNYYTYKEQDLNSEEYQSTLDIDLAVRFLLRCGKISELEETAFYYFLSGYSFRKIALMLNLNRKAMSVRIREIIKQVSDLYNA